MRSPSKPLPLNAPTVARAARRRGPMRCTRRRKAHTAEAYPHEAAGIVERRPVCAARQSQPTPSKDVALDDDDLLRVAKAELFFHSHPDGVGCPSESDMRYQQQLAIPFVVMVWPLYDVFWLGDQLDAARRCSGAASAMACTTATRCCATTTSRPSGITLIDQPRDWDWWDTRDGAARSLSRALRARRLPQDPSDARRPSRATAC